MKWIVMAVALTAVSMLASPASAQVCGSKAYAACVPCCQGTGRDLNTCKNYCKRPMSEKRKEAEKDRR